MKLKVGDKLKSECLCCDKEEIWEVQTISNGEYLDGVFETFHLKSLKHCLGEGTMTSIKNIPKVMERYEIVT